MIVCGEHEHKTKLRPCWFKVATLSRKKLSS